MNESCLRFVEGGEKNGLSEFRRVSAREKSRSRRAQECGAGGRRSVSDGNSPKRALYARENSLLALNRRRGQSRAGGVFFRSANIVDLQTVLAFLEFSRATDVGMKDARSSRIATCGEAS
jgi:hypothetical protein